MIDTEVASRAPSHRDGILQLALLCINSRMFAVDSTRGKSINHNYELCERGEQFK